MWDTKTINLTEAMDRVLGHKDMYIRWLKKFFDPDTLNEVKTAFEQADYDLAHRAVHKLKGTAANLAITELTERAMMLDTRIKDGEPFLEMQSDLDNLTVSFYNAKKMFEENEYEIMNYPV